MARVSVVAEARIYTEQQRNGGERTVQWTALTSCTTVTQFSATGSRTTSEWHR
jgi:hypothetical protein